MAIKIDPELAAYIGYEPILLEKTEGPDAIDKLFEEGSLAARLGGGELARARVERFADETTQRDTIAKARNSEIYKNRCRQCALPAPASSLSKSADDMDEEIITEDDHRLEKSESSRVRKKRNYGVWMREQIALGKSARDLIDFAARTDAGVAALLTEVAAEL